MATVTPAGTAEVADVLRDATAKGLAVLPRGAATTLSWGPPAERVDVELDTRAMTGVVEHEAGDLVATVRAGTPIAELQAAVAPSGQRLALDGLPPEATVGGLLAGGVSGPSRVRYGTLRDLVIGATFVRADGVVARTGGKVVKNVAGYDLAKLLHGSCGTLAVVTEVVVRLHPLPQAQRWVVAPLVDAAAQRGVVVDARVVPVALEIDVAAGELAVLLEGPEAAVEARAGRLADAIGGKVADAAPPWWGCLPGTRGDVLVALSCEPARIGALLGALEGVDVRGSAGVGALRGAARPAALTDVVSHARPRIEADGGHLVVLDGPPPLLERVDRWGRVDGLALMRAVKDRFDPTRTLAPGRFVGGI